MKRVRSEKNGTINVQKTLKKRQTAKRRREAGTRTGVQYMKEKDEVYDAKLADYSTPREEESSAMRTIAKVMTLLCFIYIMDLRYLAEDEERSAGKDLSREKGSVLADHPYNV